MPALWNFNLVDSILSPYTKCFIKSMLEMSNINENVVSLISQVFLVHIKLLNFTLANVRPFFF